MRKIEFFTIVLNGMPFIKHHLQEFDKLEIPWTWHIIEGVADYKFDTAWGLNNGGKILNKFHTDKYLSIDGTTEYIDTISSNEHVKVYRKNDIWNGKLEMVNAPIASMESGDDVLLVQLDVDELWTVDNINKVLKMYDENPTFDCCHHYCFYFLGKNKYVVSDNTYGTGYTHFPRTWRFTENRRWISHEPATLSNSKGIVVDRNHSLQYGISFQHYAYATEESVEFKEYYYGYKDAVSKWKKLQETTGRVNACEYLDWVSPWGACIVDDWNRPSLMENL